MKNYIFYLITLFFSINTFSQVNKFKSVYKKEITSLNFSYETIKYNKAINQVYVNKLSIDKINGQKLRLEDTIMIILKDNLTGNPSFIKKTNSLSSSVFNKKIESYTRSEIQNLAFGVLNEIATTLKIEAPEKYFSEEQNEIDAKGNLHIKMKQHINGIPIYGGELIVHLSKIENASYVNGNYYNIKNKIDTNNLISEKVILDKIENDLITDKKIKLNSKKIIGIDYSPEIRKLILPGKNPETGILVYHITCWSEEMSRWEYFISATNGDILRSFKSSCSIDVPTVSSGKDLSGVTRTFGTLLSKNTYYLMDVSRSMYNKNTGTGIILTYDHQNDTAKDVALASSKNNVWEPKAVSAHSNAILTYEYFRNIHGRNSIDNKGMNIISVFNVPDPKDNKGLDNAYWNGKQMFYGNGRIDFKSPIQAAEDVVGHEMAHGVTQYTAGLEYYSQSGAINESMSDVFAVLIDTTNWLVGEKVVNPVYFRSGALRDMSNPHNGGQKLTDYGWQPDHMSEYYTGDLDNQGVHINSGIPNRAFYIIASDPLIGRSKAGKIYYHALTKYLFRKSEFSDLRLAVIQSAKDLYGNTEVSIAKKAFDAVGITENIPIIEFDTLKINPGTEYLLTYDTDKSDPNGLFRRSSKVTDYKVILNKTVASKPSVTDNGKTAVYVGTDKRIYSISLDPSLNADRTVVQDQEIWANVAISKDGKRIAAVTTAADTSIYVYDFEKKAWYRYLLYAPTFTYGIDAKGPIFADGLEWDYTGQNLIYDCFNSLKDSSGKNITYWDIGLINVWNTKTKSKTEGRITRLFSLSDGDNVGNPTFSKNYPGKIAFDYYSALDTSYAVIGYDMKLNDVKIIALNNTIGYPSFDRLDQRVAFGTDSSRIDVIKYVNLDSNKISSKDKPKKLVNYAKWPIFFTFGNRNIVVPPKPVISSSGSNGICSGQSVLLTSSSDIGNQWYKNGLKIASGVGKTFQATETGNYMVIATVDSVSSAPSTPVSVIVNPKPIKPIITRDNQGFLVSSSVNNNQWYKESTFTGDTTQKYKPTTSGNYSVKVTKFGCASDVTSYYYLLSASYERPLVNKIIIYPNPSKNDILIQQDASLNRVLYVSISDLGGKELIKNKKVPINGKFNMDILPKGNYIIQLKDISGKLIKTQKLIKN